MGTPQVDPQTKSPLFFLPPELGNCIYNYLFAPVELTRVNRRPSLVELDIVTNVMISDALLRTCRFAQLEVRGIFDRSPARRKFWQNVTFVLNLDDSRYDDTIRPIQEYDHSVLNGIEDRMINAEIKGHRQRTLLLVISGQPCLSPPDLASPPRHSIRELRFQHYVNP